MKKVEEKLFNIAYVSLFFMYFKLIPIDIETQPIFLIICMCLIIATYVRYKKIVLCKSEIPLYLTIIILFIYFLFDCFMGKPDLLSFFKLLLGPCAYILILKNVEYLHYKSIKYIVYLLFIVFVIQVTNMPILSSIINSIYNMFFDRWNDNIASTRGLGVLVPEPSYFVYFAMLLLYSLDCIKNNYKVKNIEINLLKLMVIVMSAFTKSATVYLFLFIYLTQFLKLSSIKNILYLMLVGFFLFFIINTFSSSRIEEVFTNLISSFTTGNNIIQTLFFSDASGGFRFLINFIYYISILIHPFGYGLGGMAAEWYEVANAFNINVWNNSHFQYTIKPDQLVEAQSYMANMVGSIGILSIFLFIYIFCINNLNTRLKKNIYLTLVVFLILYQSNMFNPCFWVLIGFIKSDNRTEALWKI